MSNQNSTPTERPPANVVGGITADELDEIANEWDARAREAEQVPSSYRTRALDLRRLAANLRDGGRS